MPLICPICWSSLDQDSGGSGGSDCVALHCGHVFHHNCLLPWLQEQPTCAQCRTPVFDRSEIMKLFFSSTDADLGKVELTYMQHQLEKATTELEAAREETRRTSHQLGELSGMYKQKEDFSNNLLKELVACQKVQCDMRDQLRKCHREKKELELRLTESEQLASVSERRLRRLQAATGSTPVQCQCDPVTGTGTCIGAQPTQSQSHPPDTSAGTYPAQSLAESGTVTGTNMSPAQSPPDPGTDTGTHPTQSPSEEVLPRHHIQPTQKMKHRGLVELPEVAPHQVDPETSGVESPREKSSAENSSESIVDVSP